VYAIPRGGAAARDFTVVLDGAVPAGTQDRVRRILQRDDVLERLPASRETVVTIGPQVTAGATLDIAHATWTRSYCGEVETPGHLPRQPAYARCPAGLVHVTVQCIDRRSGGMSSYYGFDGYFASLLISVEEEVVWDARGEAAS
jgi:hypothetical protein